MRTLYKYYSALPDTYLLNPTIKLTPPSALNDPFENIIPGDIINFIFNDSEMSSIAHEYMRELKINRHDFIHQINMGLAHCGIVSLSETPRNLLMWAHYGAQHKGICIGYKSDFLNADSKNNIAESENDIPYFYHPIKVNYDTVRLAPNETKIIKHEGKSLMFNILSHMLTIKGDEWIYEKEHRCIVPIYWGDCYTTQRPYFVAPEAKNGIIDLKENEYISFINSMFILHDDKDDTKFLAPERTSIFKKIPPEMIDSIYFGCRADIKYTHQVLHTIKNNQPKLGHIKAYVFNASSYRYELEAEAC